MREDDREKLFFSTRPVLDTMATLIGTSRLPTQDLAPTQTHGSVVTLTIPAGAAAQPWYVRVQADALGAVSESNETNNVRSVALSVTAGSASRR